jgi:hypothetical protein
MKHAVPSHEVCLHAVKQNKKAIDRAKARSLRPDAEKYTEALQAAVTLLLPHAIDLERAGDKPSYEVLLLVDELEDLLKTLGFIED